MLKEKRLFLTSLQQTCNEYLYFNINKSKLAFLLQKSSGDFWVIFTVVATPVQHLSIPAHLLHPFHRKMPFVMASNCQIVKLRNSWLWLADDCWWTERPQLCLQLHWISWWWGMYHRQRLFTWWVLYKSLHIWYCEGLVGAQTKYLSIWEVRKRNLDWNIAGSNYWLRFAEA